MFLNGKDLIDRQWGKGESKHEIAEAEANEKCSMALVALR